MLKHAISKNSMILLLVIASLACILSILSYQYTASTSDKIADIASMEIRSNTKIEVHDLSQSLANRLQTITALLQTLADSPALHNNEFERAFVITNYRQNYTNDLTDFYMWLDNDGQIVWISNLNRTAYQKYKGLDLSYRSYFIEPKNTHEAYYSSLIESNDKVPRLFISYPILSKAGPEYNIFDSNSSKKVNQFKGVVVAAAKGITIGYILKSQLLSQDNSSIDLVDNNGVILFTSNASLIGKNIFGDDYQAFLSSQFSSSEKQKLNQLYYNSLHSNSSSVVDINSQGKLYTKAYEPVSIKGRHFLTLYVTAAHNLASNVAEAIDQQKIFSTIIVVSIGGIALGGAILVLTWNNRLENTVNARTQALREANTLLTTSNNRLAIANKQLEHQDKLQKEFINVAAHELRTPIQPILTVAEILKTKTENKQQKDLLDVLLKNAKRFQRLSQDILDVTMIEGQSLKLNKEQLCLDDLIIEVFKNSIQQVENSGNIKLACRLDKSKNGRFIIMADRERITQVIYNLLNNALKFTNEGTITISAIKRAKITGGATGYEAVVSVEDTGQGIDPEILPRLFSKFATSSFQGTGLGLYISKNIIEAHGGKIWARNNDGKSGATFYFSLPLFDADKQLS